MVEIYDDPDHEMAGMLAASVSLDQDYDNASDGSGAATEIENDGDESHSTTNEATASKSRQLRRMFALEVRTDIVRIQYITDQPSRPYRLIRS
jgi:hypothetical protein